MQDEAIQVHTGALRGCAAELADTGYRLGHGLQALPGLTVAAPQWQAATALAALESAVHGYLTAFGERAAQASAGLRAAAEAYEAVDERAAGRLKRWR